MSQSKRPKDLGLEIGVLRPEFTDSSGGSGNRYSAEELDSGGRHIFYEMVMMKGQRDLSLELRRGMSPGAAALLLRNIADLLERHGARLLSMPRGGEGYFDNHGDPQDEPLQLERDEHGDLEPPEFL